MRDRPEGRRFSELYVERGPASADDPKARQRLSSYLHNILGFTPRKDLADHLTTELGILFSSSLDFDGIDVNDFLDTITCIYEWLNDEHPPAAKDYRDFVERVFEQQNLNYEIDGKGGVHVRVDAEFQQNLTSVLRGLSNSKFKAASHSVASIQRALDQADGRQAVRHTFDAAESIFKTTLGAKVIRLGTAEIKAHLKPKVQPAYAGAAEHAARLMLQSFESWVAAAHFYRHVEGEPDPPPPPMDIAVMLVSVGLGFIRWLLDMEHHLQS